MIKKMDSEICQTKNKNALQAPLLTSSIDILQGLKWRETLTS